MIRYYIQESILNLRENKKNIVFFLFFLVLSFVGIAVVDSMIYSVSSKAEEELNISGNNIITINFFQGNGIDKIYKIFHNYPAVMSFHKKLFISVADNPYSENLEVVHGVDDLFLNKKNIKLDKAFKGNVVVISESVGKTIGEQVFIGEIPFTIIGIVNNKKTDFLESLGVSVRAGDVKYMIPIHKAFSLSLSQEINGVDFILHNDVTQENISAIKKILLSGGVSSFSVVSFLDAKKTVSNVMGRFHYLINIIYIILNLSASLSIVTVCKRNFHLRSTEFSLKIIHGIAKQDVLYVVTLEIIILSFFGVVISMLFSFFLIKFLSVVIGLELKIRVLSLFVSFCVLFFICLFSSFYYGFIFFKKNPIDIIKGRLV